MNVNLILFVLPLVFALICLWQVVGGMKLIATAKANPNHPHAPVYAKVGRIKAGVGTVFVLLNLLGILFNLKSIFP